MRDDQNPEPCWLLLGETRRATQVLCEAFGGPWWRQFIKTLMVPHLTVPGRDLVVGIVPLGPPTLWWRVKSSVLQTAWLVSRRIRFVEHRDDELPWGLRATRTRGWRVVNLARSGKDKRAAASTFALALFALALADRHGMRLQVEVAHRQPRLLRVYERYGFQVVSRNDRDLILRREPIGQRGPQRAWRQVLRTGRTSADAWTRRFGPVLGPVLDVGAGDSPFCAQLRDAGHFAVALDPQYALRPPTWPESAPVAALAEALPFRNGAFGTVSTWFTLQHASDPEIALTECLRVTRRGGLVVVHPVWARGRRLAALSRLPGARVIPGRALPPGRQRPSLVIRVSEFDAALNLSETAWALAPSAPVRAAGNLAMRALVRVGGTTSLGPGARR